MVDFPEELRWLDDAARAIYEAAHRYSDASDGVLCNVVPWGSGDTRRPWAGIQQIATAWCFYASLALAGQPWDRLAAVAIWAHDQAAEHREPPAGSVHMRPFSALAEEAERLTAAMTPQRPPWNGPRRYRSDDRDLDQHDLDLVIAPPDGNGDWYVSVVPHGRKIGPTVRITTSGSPRGMHAVPVAVAQLYDALGGDTAEGRSS